jgi:hypothetical protein
VTLLDMLEEPRGRQGADLVVDQILAQLTSDEAERVRYALSNRAFPIPQIMTALASAGHTVSETTLRAYRRRMLG